MYEEHSSNWQGKPSAGKESQDVRQAAAVIAYDFCARCFGAELFLGFRRFRKSAKSDC